MEKSSMTLLKDELMGTLGFMHLVDSETNWKEIKEEIQFGVTSVPEITEMALSKLKNWLSDETNEERIEIDMLDAFYNDLEIRWNEVISQY